MPDIVKRFVDKMAAAKAKYGTVVDIFAVLKIYIHGSGLLPSPRPVYATEKKKHLNGFR